MRKLVPVGVSCQDDFFILYRVYIMTGSFPGGGGTLRYFLGGYVPPGTPNWHPVLKTNSFKIDTPF